MSTEYPPPPLDAMQEDHQQTLQQIAADTRWLRAETVCLEAAIDNLAKSIACLVDTLAELDLEPEEQDDPAMTLDGDPAGQPRDQAEPL